MFQETTALHKLLNLKKRIRGVAGGTSASKTISIIQILIDKAQRDATPTLTSITSESMPHLKRGCIRDFINIMEQHNYFKDAQWNKTDYVYTLESGSKIEFFSLDMPHKVRGPRRQRLFINEANNIPLETFDQLEVRTTDEIWLDWNPTQEFWWYTEVSKRDDTDFLILTYKDNEGLQPEIVKSIEQRKGNKNWWRVYGEGQLGEVEGKIYKDWKIIDDIPHEARLERYGLDFGYSNDPTAIVAIVVADSAEPKSIDEIMSYGVNIIPANKGQGSVLQGIQWVQDQRISITKRSVNGIREYRNYMWQTNNDGKIINVPDVGFDHFQDALRYGMESLRPADEGYENINDHIINKWRL
jgi:phage terminase large subunit